jgi:hypothetical protein
MISFNSNIGAVTASLTSKMKEFQGAIKDKVLRTVASDELALVKVRIHQDGKNSEDSPMGEYSSAYLKYRQKKPFNNTSDTKIILSLTRKLQNEFVVVPTENGYGLGWLVNERPPDKKAEKKKKSKKQKSEKKKTLTNKELADILDEKYNVYKLTSSEKAAITPAAERAIKEELRRLQLL